MGNLSEDFQFWLCQEEKKAEMLVNFLSIFAGLAVTALSSGITYFMNKASVPELVIYPHNISYFANYLIVPLLQQLVMIAVFYRKAKLRQTVVVEVRSWWKDQIQDGSKMTTIKMAELNQWYLKLRLMRGYCL